MTFLVGFTRRRIAVSVGSRTSRVTRISEHWLFCIALSGFLRRPIPAPKTIAQERFGIENGRPALNAEGVPGRFGHPSMLEGRPARIAGELR